VVIPTDRTYSRLLSSQSCSPSGFAVFRMRILPPLRPVLVAVLVAVRRVRRVRRVALVLLFGSIGTATAP